MNRAQQLDTTEAFWDLSESDLENVAAGKANMGAVVAGTLATRFAGGIAFGRWLGPLPQRPIATPGATHGSRGH